MEIKGSHCLVTGGAGFIGSHLVDRLVSMGARVSVIDNLENGKLENIAHHGGSAGFRFIRGSITDPFDVRTAMDGVDAVFHMACLGVRHSLVHPFENHRVNAEGTLLVLEAARVAGVKRFLYCSSSEVYGTAERVPMPETHPTHPCTVYGASKLAGEAYARAYYRTHGMDVFVIRPFNAFGPRSHHEGDAGEVIPKSIVRALGGREIAVYGDGSQTRDFTFVTDVAAALVKAMENGGTKGRTLNVGCNFEITIQSLAEKIVSLVGNPRARVVNTPSRPGDVLRLYADPSAFISLTGWKPSVSLDEGLMRTVEHFRSHPLGIEGLLATEAGRSWER